MTIHFRCSFLFSEFLGQIRFHSDISRGQDVSTVLIEIDLFSLTNISDDHLN